MLSGGKISTGTNPSHSDKIQRSNLDRQRCRRPRHRRIDRPNRHQRWMCPAERCTGRILSRIRSSGSQPGHGSGVEDLVTSDDGLVGPTLHRTLDVITTRKDVLDGCLSRMQIQRSNLDGGGVEDLVTRIEEPKWHRAWTCPGGKMYWHG